MSAFLYVVFSRGRAGVRLNRCLCFFAYLPRLGMGGGITNGTASGIF